MPGNNPEKSKICEKTPKKTGKKQGALKKQELY